jgi:hypothetical protein
MSAADQSREEQGFFGHGIEIADNCGVSRRLTYCSGITEIRKVPEPFFGFQKGLCVVLIEPVPSVAAMIHDDLSCHH